MKTKYNSPIEFKDCKLYHNGDYCSIIFNSGEETSNWPHQNKDYVEVAKQCGFDENSLMNYCFEHEFFHILVPARLLFAESYVATRTARRIKMSIAGAKAEERLVYYFQRWFAFPDDNQMLDHGWDKLAEEAREMLYVKEFRE